MLQVEEMQSGITMQKKRPSRKMPCMLENYAKQNNHITLVKDGHGHVSICVVIYVYNNCDMLYTCCCLYLFQELT